MTKIHGGLICLAFAALAGCSTADDLIGDDTAAFPNINTQAVQRPEGLLSPQQSQAEIDALNALAAQHAAEAEREIAASR
jgi:hypothetical protein